MFIAKVQTPQIVFSDIWTYIVFLSLAIALGFATKAVYGLMKDKYLEVLKRAQDAEKKALEAASEANEARALFVSIIEDLEEKLQLAHLKGKLEGIETSLKGLSQSQVDIARDYLSSTQRKVSRLTVEREPKDPE